jgi:Flp pilus assembly pilin Flp
MLLAGWNATQQMTQSKDERGQTTAEYVAVTALAVVITLGVVWSVLSAALHMTVEGVGTAMTDFLADALA